MNKLLDKVSIWVLVLSIFTTMFVICSFVFKISGRFGSLTIVASQIIYLYFIFRAEKTLKAKEG